MSDSAVLLVRAVARAFADGRRVVLCGADFETLQLLAEAEVKELVAVFPEADPDAPAGQTAAGAPLKLRPDFRERANSKDLVVDPTGEAPADEVARLLKKQGVYLTAARGPALEAMTHVTAVGARQAAALVAGHGGQPRAVVLDGGTTAEVEIFLGAMHAPIAAPAVVCTVPHPAGAPSAEDSAALADAHAQAAEAQAHLLEAMARFDALEQQAAEAEGHRDAALAAAGQMRDRAQAAEAALEEAERAQQAAEQGRRAAEAALAKAQGELAAVAAKAAEHAELERDYEAVRQELAERRVADKRA
ncbi:MAG: hypothetical protein KC613_23235, partial [Myxococcales bacterium]|nr:hypothetical protein [Myxococcales bacterium]